MEKCCSIAESKKIVREKGHVVLSKTKQKNILHFGGITLPHSEKFPKIQCLVLQKVDERMRGKCVDMRDGSRFGVIE
jgi:hypothetical protein